MGKDTVYYFIMGRRSQPSRIFAIEPDGIRTEAHDPALLEDPSLIIYHPVRTMGDALVVTNGDQTDTIVEAGDFRAGCLQREYEPDAPNFTPRISAIVNPDGSFEMSILKHADGDRCTREFFAYEGVDEAAATSSAPTGRRITAHLRQRAHPRHAADPDALGPRSTTTTR
ncbi:MAG: IMP cyclohydrolase [Eggerthella lenta]